MKRSVLVTGASGFIGGALVVALARDGWQVRAASRNSCSIGAPSGVERVPLPDLSTPIDWSPLLAGVSHVVHLAGIVHSFGDIPQEQYARINAEAVGELAEAARGSIERLVFTSSARVQAGLSELETVSEKDPPHPLAAYGQSKLAAEHLIKESGVPFTVLRPTVVYGRGVKGNIARLAALARTPLPIPFGRLHNRRSLLALENLQSAILLVMTSDRAVGEVFLVADQEPISTAEMIAAMREGLGRDPGLIGVPLGILERMMVLAGKQAEWERISGRLIVDASKLCSIGWLPRVKTREGLAQMMRSAE